MKVCSKTKCTVMGILRSVFYISILACALITASTVLPDLSIPFSNTEGTLASHYEPSYIIVNSGLCPDIKSSLKVLILVTSAPEHFGKRQSVRLTWGHFTLRQDIVIAFILGSVSNSSLQERIEKESETYMDIIQTKNVDAYENLTLKTLSMLEWVNQYCAGISFILKTDDDVFINVPRLLLFLDKHRSAQNTIFGHVPRNWRPIRNNSSKYYVSKKIFRDPLYPSFTTGPAYLMTGDVLTQLTSAARMERTFPLEDVFFTGIVAEKLMIKRVNDPQFHPYIKKNVHHVITKLISIHNMTVYEQFSLWTKVAINLT